MNLLEMIPEEEQKKITEIMMKLYSSSNPLYGLALEEFISSVNSNEDEDKKTILFYMMKITDFLSDSEKIDKSLKKFFEKYSEEFNKNGKTLTIRQFLSNWMKDNGYDTLMKKQRINQSLPDEIPTLEGVIPSETFKDIRLSGYTIFKDDVSDEHGKWTHAIQMYLLDQENIMASDNSEYNNVLDFFIKLESNPATSKFFGSVLDNARMDDYIGCRPESFE